MFSGLVEEAGRIESIESAGGAIRLVVSARRASGGVRAGQSVAVNGCCLTVVKVERARGAARLHFDLLQETWRRTGFAHLSQGRLVNLERSLRLNDRLGGHLVTGHVDGTGEVQRWEPAGTDWLLDIRPCEKLMRYFIDKGSVAVDGMSLTVAEVFPRTFRVWIIPHTYRTTNLHERTTGELVNLEADLIGKYVERLMVFQSSAGPGPRAPSSNKARSGGYAWR